MIRSKRLRAVADMVSPGYSLADIGTDHGFIPIDLVAAGTCPFALAMDINQGPLERARAHIREEGLEERIQTRLSDGLVGLEAGETDTILIAGMGGPLILRILQEESAKAVAAKELVLSPHSEWELVRRSLWADGFRITDEDMVYEDGKYYIILKGSYRREDGGMQSEGLQAEGLKTASGAEETPSAEAFAYEAEETPSEEAFAYGALLIERRHPVLKDYLQAEHEKYSQILQGLSAQPEPAESTIARIEDIKHKLAVNEAAFRRYGE